MNPPIKDWSKKKVWIIGASSGIGLALADQLNKLGAFVVVSARRLEPLERFTSTRNRSQAVAFDAAQANELKEAYELIDADQSLDLIVYCAGCYTPMRAHSFNLQTALDHMHINYFGALNLLDACLTKFLSKGFGHISFVSSVAGYSGLPKSLAYGPSKSALTHMAEVLYLDLKKDNIGISVVHPGFVETELTAQNDFKMPALISSEQAALEMIKGYELGHFEIHFPKRFTRFLKFLRILPYRLYFAIVSRFTGL